MHGRQGPTNSRIPESPVECEKKQTKHTHTGSIVKNGHLEVQWLVAHVFVQRTVVSQPNKRMYIYRVGVNHGKIDSALTTRSTAKQSSGMGADSLCVGSDRPCPLTGWAFDRRALGKKTAPGQRQATV